MISAFVSATADLDALEAWSDECGVHRRRDAGAGPARDIVVLGPSKMCDCGVAIGAAPPTGDDNRGHEERIVRELRQRGWSEAKIRRATEQRAQARQRRDDRQQTKALAGAQEW
jgi:hypothetical protein